MRQVFFLRYPRLPSSTLALVSTGEWWAKEVPFQRSDLRRKDSDNIVGERRGAVPYGTGGLIGGVLFLTGGSIGRVLFRTGGWIGRVLFRQEDGGAGHILTCPFFFLDTK